MNRQDLIFAGVIFGVIILGVLLSPIDAVPTIGDIPPTRAFQKIFTNGDNVTATKYNANLNITSGANMLIEAFFSNSTLRFSATAPTIYMQQIANVTSIGCALGQALTVNASAIWDCSNVGTGDVTGAANVGTGTGLVFRDETTGTLNLRTIKQNGNVTITTVGDEILISATGGTASSVKIDNATVTRKNFIVGINNQTGDITKQTFALNNQTVSRTQWLVGINNVTGVNTVRTFAANSVTCSAGQFVSSFSNTTGVYSCTTPSGGGATVLAANVTGTLPGTDYLVWTIPLTANSGNTVTGTITATSTVSGTAVSAGANVTNLNTRGFCHWVSVATTTSDSIDNIVMNTVATGRVTKNAETLWIAGANVAQPISFECSVTTGPTAGNLRVFISPEVAGATIAAKAGSYYIKTP